MSAIDLNGRKMPPVARCSSAALVLVIVGGIDLASYAPRHAPLAFPTVLLVAAALFTLASLVLLSRVSDFGWSTFRKVFRWALLAYVIVAGMIEFAFVIDHVRGSSLLVVTLMLMIFAFSVPMNIAYTTARFAEKD
ncbi:MAG TPA: hypothetical protein VMU98_01250 [Acidimicrobiales bacterium]|nr:hypothetical protein [Acidimicrobiales bacterium]